MFPDIWLAGPYTIRCAKNEIDKTLLSVQEQQYHWARKSSTLQHSEWCKIGRRGGGVKALYVLFQLETYTLTFEMSVLVQKLSILLT